MEDLRNIIADNIEWFWDCDPILEHETETDKLWEAFYVWCNNNCKDIFGEDYADLIDREINRQYSNWKKGFNHV